jgi:ATP-dependent Clp protease adaptor protein ClpS
MLPMPTRTADQTIAKERSEVKRPALWTCLFFNDDYTPMAFVVELLIVVFNQRAETAELIMRKIHREGKSTVGVFPRDIAIIKADQSMELAKSHGFPLQVTPQELPPV